MGLQYLIWFSMAEIEPRSRIGQEAFRTDFILSGSRDQGKSGVVLDPVGISQAPSGSHVLSNVRTGRCLWCGQEGISSCWSETKKKMW